MEPALGPHHVVMVALALGTPDSQSSTLLDLTSRCIQTMVAF